MTSASPLKPLRAVLKLTQGLVLQPGPAPGGEVLLELFSGTGSVGRVFREAGWDVTSVDLDPKAGAHWSTRKGHEKEWVPKDQAMAPVVPATVVKVYLGNEELRSYMVDVTRDVNRGRVTNSRLGAPQTA